MIDPINQWIVDHSSRLIAAYDGTPGGTRNTAQYASQVGGIINIKFAKRCDSV